MFYVYLLKSKKSGKFYIGSTVSIIKRFKDHNNGEVRSTRPYRPWELIYYEAYKIEKLARLREKKLKHFGNGLRELKKRIEIY